VASALCARLASGKAGRRIEAQKPAATQACSQLMSSYSSAQAAVTAANSAFQQAREGAISARDGACSQAYASHEYAACRAARLAFRATIVSLRANRRTTLAQFPPSVESARMTFWQTITALRNG
jgi:multidrug resistance efflux pump